MEGNPKAAIRAILGVGGKLTLARLALLERAKSPVLNLDLTDLNADIQAAYLYSVPFEDAVSCKDVPNESLRWLNRVGYDAYDEVFNQLIDALVAYYEMIPPQKKTEDSGSETDGSQN